MRHMTDAMIDTLVTAQETQQVLLDAFRLYGAGHAAMQNRMRTEAGGVKLSTLGAVIPDQGVTGAKVYTTIKGQFSFVILLFSTDTGQPLASFDANAITRLRTAACSVIAARYLARTNAQRLAIFGAGIQGLEHACQMSGAFPLKRISLCTRNPDPQRAEELAQQCNVEVVLCGVEQALEDADIVVTATRSTTPLFKGAALAPGCFVAAVGSSLPHTRELDDAALARATTIAVEWRDQTLREAGDLVLADPSLLPAGKIVELGELVSGTVSRPHQPQGISIYKSVGVGLEDIALAGLVWKKFTGG